RVAARSAATRLLVLCPKQNFSLGKLLYSKTSVPKIIPFFFGSGTETPEAVMEITENSCVFISSIPEDIALIANSVFSRQADEQWG
ncbi:MAG: hypothetical protein DCE90_20030, partial [Pseudanabaena sp.]